MQFSVQREVFLRPLQQVVGVVERRQTLPVLSNLLVVVSPESVSVTATDLEVEMVGRFVVSAATPGEITIPAKKLFDIMKALPDGCRVDVQLGGDKVTVSAGRSRFTLSTLPASDFPAVEEREQGEVVSIAEAVLRRLVEQTAFAMAHQDVRYYLNGLLLEVREGTLRCVATDGHRLALADGKTPVSVQGAAGQIIVPRKGVLELQRLLEGGDGSIEMELGRNHLRVTRGEFVLSTKLIDGRFPDYDSVIPIGADQHVILDRDGFRTALQRAAILSNEKYRGVKLEVSKGRLRISSNNPEQEEAVEEIEAETQVDDLSVGFNVNYLMDALNALGTERVRLSLRDSNSSCLLRAADSDDSRHVIMPLRL